ncbi:dynein regulatory complex subunit 7-like [Belonocnema kinseyi]|uniref:dynein regulatory complex subunit 7-like n=1 Tax=Belonocnema kinseyi TaxID=2817044 RepID=UPI00143DA475|nr:dynein regulatory complex subunit 7-like [Belonocnema kinseyi]
MSEETKSFSGEYVDGCESEFEEKIDQESVEEQVDSERAEITEETLKRIQRELCLIKLCWPKIEIDQESEYLRLLPEIYSRNSEKEKLLLWYAENFRRQYHTIYKNRKPLLLACENECGIQKFVSTTIRRSTLPYPELCTWQGCTKFVSDYVTYESLKRPLVMVSSTANHIFLIDKDK